MAIFNSFRSDPFIARQRLARALENNPDRLTVRDVVVAAAYALLASGLALALTAAWLGIVGHAPPLASIMAVPLP